MPLYPPAGSGGDHGTLAGLLDDDHTQYTLSTELDAHDVDTTSVHGIANTANLALTADVVTKALLDAKGDLIVASAADTPARLAVGGTDGHILTVDAAEATGMKWAAAAGGNDPRIFMKALTAGQQFDVTASTVLVEVTNLTQALGVGTFNFRYNLIYRSNQAGTGIRYAVNYDAASGAFVWNSRFVGLIATASDANPDQDGILAAANVMNAFSSRAKTTTTRGVTLTVDTANADMLYIIEGTFLSTGAGNLELWTASEANTAGHTTSTMVGSNLVVEQVA